MKKVLFYAMTGERGSFQHILLNALDLAKAGAEVKIIFEGLSVKLVPEFEQETHELYFRAKDLGLIAGICKGCSEVLGVLEKNQESGLTLLDDMDGHAGMKDYLKEGYSVISI
ncbi:MAG: hypothetical protein ACOX7U_03310 [Desulfitobacteriia bacterium]|jgi:hypothetical protein